MEDLLTGDIRPVRRAPPPPRSQPRNDELLVIQSVIDDKHQPLGGFISNPPPPRPKQNGLPRSASLPLTNGISSHKKKPPPRPPPPKNNPSQKGHQDLNGSSHRHSVVGGIVGKIRGPPPARPRPASVHVSSSTPGSHTAESQLIDFSSPPGSPTTRSGSDGLSVNSLGSESSSGNQSTGFDDAFDPFGSIMENNMGGKEVGSSSFFTGGPPSASTRSTPAASTKEVGVSSFFTGSYSSQPPPTSATSMEDSQDPFEMLARRTEMAAKQSKPPPTNYPNVTEVPKPGMPVTPAASSSQSTAQILNNNKPKTKPNFRPTIIRTKSPVTSSQVESAGGSSLSTQKDELKGIDWSACSKTSSNSGWGDPTDHNVIDQTIPEEPPPPLPPRPEEEEEDQDRPYGIAEYDYGGESGDLSFKIGETIQLLYRVNDEWLFGRCGPKEGMFPEAFVKIVVPLAGEGTQSSSSASTPVNPSGHASAASWPTTAVTTPSNEVVSNMTPSNEVVSNNIVTALYTFQAEAQGDLTIHEGCQVRVTGRLSEEWLYGECDGANGQFPANFVDRIPPSLPQI